MTLVGRLVGEAIQEMAAAARPGMTTAELDEVGAGFLRRHGARSALAVARVGQQSTTSAGRSWLPAIAV
jgi:methionine aminopeptidase